MSHSLPTPGTYHSVKKNDMGPVVPAGSCLQDVLSEKKARCRSVGVVRFYLILRWEEEEEMGADMYIKSVWKGR